MLAEFLNTIYAKADEARRIRQVLIPNGPKHLYFYETGDGELQRAEIEATCPDFTFNDLESLAALAIRWDEEATADPVAFYDRCGVVLFRSFEDRRCKATVPLKVHPTLEFIKSLAGKSFSQKDLIRLLRVELQPAWTNETEKLLACVREVKFIRNADGEAQVSAQKASVGKKLLQEMVTETPIPEKMSLCVPVFENPALSAHCLISCAVLVDLEAEKFQIIPLPGQIEKALADAEKWLHGELLKLLAEISPALSLYRGKP